MEALDTPVAVVDLDLVEANNAKMNDLCRAKRVTWRPHAKTHKSAYFALGQIRAGAVGVCVQKLGEAEALCDGGVTDIFISNEIVSEEKLSRLASLATRCALSLCVDSHLGLHRLLSALKAAQSSLRVLVDVDVGHGRCGTSIDIAVEMAKEIVANGQWVTWGGIHCYHGAIQHIRSDRQRDVEAVAVAERTKRAKEAMLGAVGTCPTVTGGGV